MRGQWWGMRGVGGVAALVLLTHCGGTEPGTPDKGTSEALSPAVLRQEAVTVVSFGATSDARVEASRPSGRFGGEPTLGVDTSPEEQSLLRFDISGIPPASITRAVLRLYAIDGTNNGPRVFATNPYFAELAVDWYNRGQPIGAALDDQGVIHPGTYVEFDVTAAVHGNDTVGFTLRPDSSDGVDFASREESREERRPRLLVTVDPAAGCLPRTDTRTLEVVASHDGYASQAEPTRRFGSAPSLRVGTSPRQEAFLRFNGYAIPEHWTQRDVSLRLFVENATDAGPRLYEASTNWPSDPNLGLDFDWNTRPTPLGPIIGGSFQFPNRWESSSVAHVVTTPGQAHAFGLIPDSSDVATIASANAPDETRRPRLAIALESEPYCTYQGSGGGFTGWTKRYGGAGSEQLHALATDAQGGFVALGFFGDSPFSTGQGFALARYAADGTPQWTREVTHDNVRATALTVTPEGNILVVGHYLGTPDLGTGPLPGTSGFFIAKFAPTGRTVWSHGFNADNGLPEDDFSYTPVYPAAVATDAQGSLVVSGNFYGQMDLGGGLISAGHASIGLTDAYAGGFVAKFDWQGQHVFSRALEAAVATPTAYVRTVATDTAGNVLLGGRASALANLGDGRLGQSTPFIAKYGPTGAFLGKRVFPGVFGEVVALQGRSTGDVAFNANLGGPFSFGGIAYVGGEPSDEVLPENLSGFTGTLSASGADGWLRPVDTSWGRIGALVTGSDGGITVTGHASATYDLGGGPLGPPYSNGPQTAFVAHYSTWGEHRWSRSFDANFRLPGMITPELRLALQPGGSVLVGGSFLGAIQLDGVHYTSSGESDLFYFQLLP
ncbi:DUF7594 domain-containing protein [Melittangium boletus]|uniref:Carbohydrate-binding module family 96 domain-containing protein n=1 Tax=Melittangium boletus DSM 14713 TaxID=1294270 RepID=A0A250IKP0_9BACT|nr:DNRLRE domain-containing protein [Melittangium boletus]ATB31496.1 hypothetical protein MEBOL_004959 [Melittangium boletus DSM 14713]